jgi:hypothetical protein
MKKTTLALCIASVALLAGLRRGEAQGTAFSYQGSLLNCGLPATGRYDFLFSAAADAGGVNLVCSPFATNAVPVSNGLFTVSIDFGNGVFNGAARWLQIEVKTNGAPDYLALTPLTPITPTPYAQYAPNAGTAGVAYTLSGALPASQLPSVVVTNNQPSVALAGTFTGAMTGDGRGLTNAIVTDAKAMFGLHGDGVTDDTAAMQAAVNWAFGAAPNNTILHIPAGRYLLSDSITLPDVIFGAAGGLYPTNAGVIMEGAGTATELHFDVANKPGIVYGFREYDTLRNMTISGPLLDDWGNNNGEVGITKSYYAAPAFHLTFDNLRLAGWDKAMAFSNCWNLTVHAVDCQSNASAGLGFCGCHDLDIDRCSVTGWQVGAAIGYVGTAYACWQAPDEGNGDNATLRNSLASLATSALWNDELNLTVTSFHAENCGVYGQFYQQTTVKGMYTLDNLPYATNGHPAYFEVGSAATSGVIFENNSITGTLGRSYLFNIISNDTTTFMPLYHGRGWQWGLYNTNTVVSIRGYDNDQPYWHTVVNPGEGYCGGSMTMTNTPMSWASAGWLIARNTEGWLTYQVPTVAPGRAENYASVGSPYIHTLYFTGEQGVTNMSIGLDLVSAFIGNQYNGTGDTQYVVCGITNGFLTALTFTNNFQNDSPVRAFMVRISDSQFDGGVTNNVYLVRWEIQSNP